MLGGHFLQLLERILLPSLALQLFTYSTKPGKMVWWVTGDAIKWS